MAFQGFQKKKEGYCHMASERFWLGGYKYFRSDNSGI